jgi:hypothetical protein
MSTMTNMTQEDVDNLVAYLQENRSAMVFVRIGRGQFRLAKGEGIVLIRTLSHNGYPWGFTMEEGAAIYIDPDITEGEH